LHLFPELIKPREETFTTGVLPVQAIRDLVGSQRIVSEIPLEENQFQPASIDLRLGPVAYRVQASFLPGQLSTVDKKVRELLMAEINLTEPALFEKGCVYIVPLMESLELSPDTRAKANPRSTTGRLDIFTRLITNNGVEFEYVPSGYKGKLYVEIVSRTFAVGIQAGMRLNQLRFMRGNPISNDKKLNELDQEENLIFLDEERPGKAYIHNGLRVSVALDGNASSSIVAFKAKRNAPAIDLRKTDYYSPELYWDFVRRPQSKTIVLDPGDFYILASKERIRVPPDFAAEMVAFDPAMGEFRIHYAGFFDPGFGYGISDVKGTQAVLEVRAHEVPFLLEDGQVVGRLVYDRLLSRPEKIYGVDIGSSYQRQVLTLSKQFRRVPLD
jgi:dCTP deaminase